jgi:putative peptidoglycan lipid II flippase
VNLFVSTLIASLLEQGSVSWLWYAFRLMQLPIGVFGVALATVSLPALSQAAVEKDMESLKRTLSTALRLVALLTVPAALWMAVEAGPIIALLYQHGRFTAHDTGKTAAALICYCVGLPAYAAVRVLVPTFYALGDTRTPVRASMVAVVLNLALNLALMRSLGHLGLALSTSVTALANLVQLAWLLRRQVGSLDGGRMLRTCLGVLAGGAAGVGAGAFAAWALFRHLAPGWGAELGRVGVSLALAVAVGALVMRVLRVEELALVEGLLRTWGARLRPRRLPPQ